MFADVVMACTRMGVTTISRPRLSAEERRRVTSAARIFVEARRADDDAGRKGVSVLLAAHVVTDSDAAKSMLTILGQLYPEQNLNVLRLTWKNPKSFKGTLTVGMHGRE